MPIQAIKRWHWLAIAVVVGLAIGSAREAARQTSHDRLDDYPTLLTSSKEFETALLRDVEGHRQFKDILVYPYTRSGGRKAHLVTGSYWNGHLELVNGQTVARWSPACYVAPVPYAATLPQPIELPSVLDYLTAVHRSHGVEWQYARFSWMVEPMFASLAISILIIGILWPSLINLLTYGSIFRPRQPAGISLWNAPARSTPAHHTPPPLADAFEPAEPPSKDVAPPKAIDTSVASVASTAAPLPTTALEPPSPLPSSPEKDFGARREDFYPTELHTPENV